MGGAAAWNFGLGTCNMCFLFHYDLKGYGNSHITEKVGGGLNLLNTKDGYCLYHSATCAFNQDCTVNTSENHFENKL